MQLALSIASVVLSLCVIGHLYRLHSRIDRAERAHRQLCAMLGIRNDT